MTPSPDFTWLFFKMLAGLILVLGLALVFMRFVLPRTRIGRGRKTDWGQLLDTVRLDQHRSLHLVKIVGRYFVLGSSEHSMNLITELSAAEWEKAAETDKGAPS